MNGARPETSNVVTVSTAPPAFGFLMMAAPADQYTCVALTARCMPSPAPSTKTSGSAPWGHAPGSGIDGGCPPVPGLGGDPVPVLVVGGSTLPPESRGGSTETKG